MKAKRKKVCRCMSLQELKRKRERNRKWFIRLVAKGLFYLPRLAKGFRKYYKKKKNERENK